MDHGRATTRRIRGALLGAALLGMLAVAATAPAAAQTVAQSGSAYAFGAQALLAGEEVLTQAEAEVDAPPFGDAVREALVDIPADPLATSGTATAFAAVSETADLESSLESPGAQHELEGPYHAKGEGVVEEFALFPEAADGADVLTADVIRGEAVAVCDGDTAQYSASSEIVNLRLADSEIPLNEPLEDLIDGVNLILGESGLDAVVDIERNVVTEPEGGGIAVTALVIRVFESAVEGADFVTISLGHGEVGALACGAAVVDNPLSVVKEGPATVNDGDQFDYTITASNNHPEAACTDVTVVDTVTGPEGTEIVAVDPGEPEGSFEGLTATFDLGTLESGETRVLTVTVQVPPGSTGTVVDDVVMTATCDGDPFEASDRLEAPDIVGDLPGAPATQPVAQETLPRTGGPVPLALAGLAAAGGLAALGLRRRLG